MLRRLLEAAPLTLTLPLPLTLPLSLPLILTLTLTPNPTLIRQLLVPVRRPGRPHQGLSLGWGAPASQPASHTGTQAGKVGSHAARTRVRGLPSDRGQGAALLATRALLSRHKTQQWAPAVPAS